MRALARLWPGWTNPGEKSSPSIGYQRRNAIGNAFAVPVMTRLLLALSLVVRGEGLSAFPSWADRNLAAPYRHDFLDDIVTEASFLANGYQDLVSEFDSFLLRHWVAIWLAPTPAPEARRIGRNAQQQWVSRRTHT